jgi:hypothetical protein
MTQPTQKQVLTVENPLGLYDGCYAKQRNGEITGPWVWGSNEIFGPGWIRGQGSINHRHNTGQYVRNQGEQSLDLIEALPPPVKLPEPIERYLIVFESGNPCSVLWEEKDLRRSDLEATLINHTTYRVRIEFLEDVKP